MLRAIGSKFVKRIGFDLNDPLGASQEETQYTDYEEIMDEELELKEIEFRKRNR